MKNKTVSVLDLGKRSFLETWDLQQKLFDEIIQIKLQNKKQSQNLLTPNYLLFVEHPHVFTMGKEKNKQHLLKSEEELEEAGLELHVINRGGDITYHGPGQLVCYPIFDLEHFFEDVHKYVRLLEESIILVLKEYGLKGERIAGKSGVWIGVNTANERKICAVGIRISRWVTMHGLAFNIYPDLSYFQMMVPCGIQNSGVTSLQKELGKIISISEIKEKVLSAFSQTFNFDIQYT